MSRFTWSWHWNASPYSQDHGLHVHRIMPPKCISQLSWSQSSGASLCSLDVGLQVHPQTRLIKASKCMSEFSRFQPRSASLSPYAPSGVKWQSYMQQSLLLTLCHTTRGIQGDLVVMSSPVLKNIEREWQDSTGYPAMINHMHWVDFWMFGNTAWNQELGQIGCVFVCMMMKCLSNPGHSKVILPVAQSLTVTQVSLFAPNRLPPAKLRGSGGETLIFPPQPPPSVSLSSPDYLLKVYFRNWSTTAFRWISRYTQSCTTCSSQCSDHRGPQVHHEVLWIGISQCSSYYAQVLSAARLAVGKYKEKHI